jgi:two-component system, NarL family, response regulator NreC
MTISVFLADDHAIVREGLSSLLNSAEDIDVLGSAGDGRQAVREVERLNPDVVVMDIAMPELNGIDATREICKINPAARVIILSVYLTLDHISLALEAGAKGYLVKGASGNEMIEAIRTVYSGHRYLSREINDLVIKDYVEHHEGQPTTGPLSSLTSRERVILQMVAEGKTSKSIAQTLGLATASVDIYRSRMMKKLGIKDVPNLVKWAIQHGLTKL